jgi:hypothetical protein
MPGLNRLFVVQGDYLRRRRRSGCPRMSLESLVVVRADVVYLQATTTRDSSDFDDLGAQVHLTRTVLRQLSSEAEEWQASWGIYDVS